MLLKTTEGYCTLFKTRDDRWGWNLKAPNHKIILRDHPVTTKADALEAIGKVQDHSDCADNYQPFQSADDKPTFRLLDACGDKLGYGETYESTQARDNGIKSCMKNGPTKVVVDLSDPKQKRIIEAIEVADKEKCGKATVTVPTIATGCTAKPKGGYYGD